MWALKKYIMELLLGLCNSVYQQVANSCEHDKGYPGSLHGGVCL